MKKRGESGFAMLLVFLMAAAIAISLYSQIPRVAFQAQRQKEQLLMERGEQYKRAIQLFVRANGRYPGRIEDLEQFNNRRFLRHKFKDPITGKDEWRLIHVNAAGVFTDSIVNKAKPGDDKGQTSTPSSIGEIAGLGVTPTGQPNVVNASTRRRASEGGANPALLGPDGQPLPYPAGGVPTYPGAQPGMGAPQPGQVPQNQGVVTPGQPAIPGQPFPNGQPGNPSQPYQPYIPNQPTSNPGILAPAPPNAFSGANTANGNFGGVSAQPYPVTGVPPEVQNFPGGGSTSLGQPGQLRNPSQQQFGGQAPGGQAGTNSSSIGGSQSSIGGTQSYMGGGSSIGSANPMPTPGLGFPQPQPTGGFAQPTGGFPQPTGGFAQPTGGFAQPAGGFAQPAGGFAQPTGGFAQPTGGFAQPNPQAQGGLPGSQLNPQANPALDAINRALTSPSTQGQQLGATQGGQQVGAGIAGVASTSENAAIMEYNDHKNYNEWEFIFDPSKQQPIPNASGGVVGTPVQNMGTFPAGTTGTAINPTAGPGARSGLGPGTGTPQNPTAPAAGAPPLPTDIRLGRP